LTSRPPHSTSVKHVLGAGYNFGRGFFDEVGYSPSAPAASVSISSAASPPVY